MLRGGGSERGSGPSTSPVSAAGATPGRWEAADVPHPSVPHCAAN